MFPFIIHFFFLLFFFSPNQTELGLQSSGPTEINFSRVLRSYGQTIYCLNKKFIQDNSFRRNLFNQMNFIITHRKRLVLSNKKNINFYII